MKPAIVLLVCLFFASAQAAPTNAVYDVEILVFENHLPELEGGEIWTQDGATAPMADLPEAVPAGETSPADASLNATAQALERNGGYHVLIHQRWRQTAEEKSASKPVRLRNADGQLEGTLRFYLSRFLHMDLDLALKDKDSAGGNMRYRLADSRRVKTQELNYFDHPKFGVLVKVTSAGKE